MKRIRVLQLITELTPAGAEKCVYELATRLDKRIFDVAVAALQGGAMVDRLEQAGVETLVLGMRGKWDIPRLTRLPGLIRRWRPDVLHTHLFHADFAGRIAALLVGGVRTVHTVHIAETRFRPWQFAFAKLAAETCEKIVAVSPSARDHHAERTGLDVDRYMVIPNGIDVDTYSRDAATRRSLRGLWSVPADEFLIAFVGRLDRQKGLDTLLEAMGILASRHHAPRLVIAGQGPQRGLLERFIAESPVGGNVMALGFTDDVPGLLSAADALVMPSRWEGFGLAAAEAMAASLPVIATGVAGLRDVVTDATAIIVSKDDSGALARAMEQLAEDVDLRRTLGRAGRRRVLELFNISDTIAAHDKLYRQVVC